MKIGFSAYGLTAASTSVRLSSCSPGDDAFAASWALMFRNGLTVCVTASLNSVETTTRIAAVSRATVVTANPRTMVVCFFISQFWIRPVTPVTGRTDLT